MARSCTTGVPPPCRRVRCSVCVCVCVFVCVCVCGWLSALIRVCMRNAHQRRLWWAQELADRGFRSLGLAVSEAPLDAEDPNWQFQGLISLYDPPRSDTKKTIVRACARR